ncbi:MAG TPA: hypothetical protein VHR17_10895 [Thermoanaerobaculia bacterium]|jgi:hypothetical protein|nr:hypothetical protein [Thermoanaerobaculia bacterium]
MTTAEEPKTKAPEGAAPAKAAEPVKASAPKLPKIEVVKPKRWDLIALAVLVIAFVLSGANLHLALREGEGAISGGVTGAFVTIQLILCLLGLMVLGKTAKEGTIWGNLFAVGACVVGMSGVLLASALWALA